MAQSNALREQPSMDEILASIRRIIDAGEAQSNAAQTGPAADGAAARGPAESTIPPAPANDAGDEQRKPSPPQTGLFQKPQTARAGAPSGGSGAERAVSGEPQSQTRTAAAGVAPSAPPVDLNLPAGRQAARLPEPDISEVEAALEAEFSSIDRDILVAERQTKYGSRFTEADDGAFREVASVLRNSLDDNGAPAAASAAEKAVALTSDSVSQSVSRAFHDLSGHLSENRQDIDKLAEEMLRPMLQDWLDNNLPSLVERLVRAEIERIARGDPRTT